MPDFIEGIPIFVTEEGTRPPTPGFSCQTWKEAVFATLQTIASTNSGAALFQTIRSTGRWIIVRPSEPECGPGSDSDLQIMNGRRIMGTLRFDPLAFMGGSKCYQSDLGWNSGANPDEVCFHELVHTYQLGSGFRKRSLDGGLKGYQDTGEFFAILLANIYISDETNHNKSGLRAGCLSGRPLEEEFSSSFGFYDSSPQVLPLMNELVVQNLSLCLAFAAVKADFNPLFAYFQNYLLAKSHSLSQTAKMREIVVPEYAVYAQ